MTRTRTIRTSGLATLFLGLLTLLPATALATNFELARLANQLNLVSYQLAEQLRYARGYGSVQLSASRLAREAAQLVDAIRRDRSPSYVRAQFRDVSRRYQNLEEAFLRASGSSRDARLFNDVGLISDLYFDLSNEIYYTAYTDPYPRIYTYVPPVQHRPFVRNQRGGRGFVAPDNRRREQARQDDRRGNREIRASQLPRNNFDHRSSVMDRQTRNDASRQRLNDIGDRRSGRGTETRRRNHYQ